MEAPTLFWAGPQLRRAPKPLVWRWSPVLAGFSVSNGKIGAQLFFGGRTEVLWVLRTGHVLMSKWGAAFGCGPGLDIWNLFVIKPGNDCTLKGTLRLGGWPGKKPGSIGFGLPGAGGSRGPRAWRWRGGSHLWECPCCGGGCGETVCSLPESQTALIHLCFYPKVKYTPTPLLNIPSSSLETP